ncbi:hypothetical protein, partial [Cereibacter sphaeroides]|uniref:hypothetical protein n=1 Tax=Cereibacter sphaeroides TaxID=1063 RepID=UPI001F34D0E8
MEAAIDDRRRSKSVSPPHSHPRPQRSITIHLEPHMLSDLDDLIHSTGATAPLSLDGWTLAAAAALETAADTRLVVPLMSASPHRRAAIHAALAVWSSPGHPGRSVLTRRSDADLVRWLLAAPADVIIDTALGDVPGLVGAIYRTEGTPLEALEDYFRLAAMLSGTGRRSRRQSLCLAHMSPVTSARLRILDVLREAFLTPDIVSRIETEEAAREIEQAANFVLARCPGLKEIVLAEAMRSSDSGNLRGLIGRMLHGHAVLDAPLPDDDDFVFLRVGAEFATLARKHRNCLGGKLMDAALGLTA